MAEIARKATSTLMGILAGSSGVPAAVSKLAAVQQLELAPLTAAQIVTHNVSHEIAERAVSVKYPLLYVYCERLTNSLSEKFRSFSGKAHMMLEVRLSQDRMEGLPEALQAYVDSVIEVLDGQRGTWSEGFYYGGGYDVTFGAIKQGGKNFLQTAKIAVQLNVSLK